MWSLCRGDVDQTFQWTSCSHLQHWASHDSMLTLVKGFCHIYVYTMPVLYLYSSGQAIARGKIFHSLSLVTLSWDNWFSLGLLPRPPQNFHKWRMWYWLAVFMGRLCFLPYGVGLWESMSNFLGRHPSPSSLLMMVSARANGVLQLSMENEFQEPVSDVMYRGTHSLALPEGEVLVVSTVTNTEHFEKLIYFLSWWWSKTHWPLHSFPSFVFRPSP